MNHKSRWIINMNVLDIHSPVSFSLRVHVRYHPLEDFVISNCAFCVGLRFNDVMRCSKQCLDVFEAPLQFTLRGIGQLFHLLFHTHTHTSTHVCVCSDAIHTHKRKSNTPVHHLCHRQESARGRSWLNCGWIAAEDSFLSHILMEALRCSASFLIYVRVCLCVCVCVCVRSCLCVCVHKCIFKHT